MTNISKFKARYLHTTIAFVLALLIYFFVPAQNGLTEVGVRTLAVVVLTAYMWVMGCTTWSSLLSMALFIIVGSANAGFICSSGFGHWVTVFIIVFALVNVALQRSGFISRFITWFITRKIVEGHPWMFVVMYFIGLYIASCFVDCVALTCIVVNILEGFCSELDYKPGEDFVDMMYIGSIWVIQFGWFATPIGHNLAIMCISIYEKATGGSLSYLNYMLVGIPTGLIMTAIFILFMKFVVKPDMSKYVNFDVEGKRKSIKKMEKPEKVTLILFLATCLSIVLPDLLVAFMPTVGSFLKNLTIIPPCIIAVTIMANIYFDGEPLIDVQRDMKEVPWGLIILLSGALVLMSVMLSENTGISEWLHYIMGNIITGLHMTSWIPVVILFALLPAIVTNFISCTTTGNLMIAVALPIALSMGVERINPLALTMVISITASIGVMTAGASSPCAILLGTKQFSSKKMFNYGLIAIPMSVILAVVFIYPLASIL